MFNRKRKKQEKDHSLLDQALEITSSANIELPDVEEPKQPSIQPDDFDQEIVVTASTIPDDAPEIGPSYREETISIGPSPDMDDTPKEKQEDLKPVVKAEEPEPIVVETEKEVPLEFVLDEPDSNEPVQPKEINTQSQLAEFDLDESMFIDLEEIEAETVVQTPVETHVKPLDDATIEWSWVDNDEPRKQSKKQPKVPVQPKPKKRNKKEVFPSEEENQDVPDFLLEEIKDSTEEDKGTMEFDLPTKDKVDLNSFFEASKQQNKLKRSERKKYSKRELKRRKKRQNRRISEEIKDQRVFKFRKKKYKDVEEFISYLNDHYLDIDDVARDVLADENFFGWVGKRSGVFPQSLSKFKEIKEKIEPKD